MEHMTLGQIAEACGGTYVGAEEKKLLSIAGAQSDSRKIEKDDLFIPIKGERVDGHTFIPSGKRKARAICRTIGDLDGASSAGLQGPLHSRIVLSDGIKRDCGLLPQPACDSNRRHYGERRQDQHQGNDRFRAFRQISCLKDRRQFQQ